MPEKTSPHIDNSHRDNNPPETNPTETSRFDVVIVGAGFAGSLAALMLHQSGFRTCLIEKESHPKFAIGESSTPAADMILRALAVDYRLPWLKNFSRYGSWQEHHPDIICGIKRGFSYYLHEKGLPFRSDRHHSHELLVAASENNQNSDTHWYRQDFDAFLAGKVKEYGIDYFDNTGVTGCYRSDNDEWTVELSSKGEAWRITSPMIIDATGSSAFSKQFFNVGSDSTGFETRSMAVYSHFEGVGRWSDSLGYPNFPTNDYPFTPDHSALHHLLDEGWMWMLRFNSGLVSAGVAVDLTNMAEGPAGFALDISSRTSEINSVPEDFRVHLLAKYPSLSHLFSGSRLAPLPGKLIRSGRLQRRLKQLTGPGWIALNHTAGFVDPLHSTGIAHTLAGLERVIPLLIETRHEPVKREKLLALHQASFFKELRLVDLLVAGCYLSRRNFPLFSAYCSLYFICTIRYEQQRQQGNSPSHFLMADDNDFTAIVENAYSRLSGLVRGECTPGSVKKYTDLIRTQIRPFNTAGLMDTDKQNMYRHTAVRL